MSQSYLNRISAHLHSRHISFYSSNNWVSYNHAEVARLAGSTSCMLFSGMILNTFELKRTLLTNNNFEFGAAGRNSSEGDWSTHVTRKCGSLRFEENERVSVLLDFSGLFTFLRIGAEDGNACENERVLHG
jgi:hypothetical protein